MDNSVVLLQRVVDQTTLLFDNVGDDQLGDPTPCTEWTIRDLMNHVTGGRRCSQCPPSRGRSRESSSGSS